MTLLVTAAAPHVTLLTIDNQAKRNALSRQAMRDLAAVWDKLDADPDCRCVIVTGAGDKAFCAGADLAGDLSVAPETARMINRALLKSSTFSKPIVAAVNGTCAGGGVELLLSTDVRIAGADAKFGLPEVKWAIYPFGGATVKLVQQIGYVHAMDLLLTARMIPAEEAARIGLVTRVVGSADVLPAALEVARAIAANSPAAVQAVKQQISAQSADFALSREVLEQMLGDRVRASPDFPEGVAAFREKRQPRY